MRIQPNSLSFTILLGTLAALPPLSIDMGLPAFPTISTSLKATLKVGLVAAVASSIALVLVSVSSAAQVMTLMPLLVLNTFCRGIIAPNAMHGAIQPVPESAGVAAAIVGFLQMLGGALASGLIAFLFDGHSVIAMCSLIALFAIASLIAYFRLARPAESRFVSEGT